MKDIQRFCAFVSEKASVSLSVKFDVNPWKLTTNELVLRSNNGAVGKYFLDVHIQLLSNSVLIQKRTPIRKGAFCGKVSVSTEIIACFSATSSARWFFRKWRSGFRGSILPGSLFWVVF